MSLQRLAGLFLGLTLGCLAFVPTVAQYNPDRDHFTRSMNRTASPYHQLGYSGVFNEHVLLGIGGVLSQSLHLEDQQNRSIDVSVGLDSGETYPGYITVALNGTTELYPIRYADLVPMALFVDSGGTSLYTLWEREQLPVSFRRDAGFTEHSGDGHIALEFAGTHYADALLFVDTCQGCLDTPNPVLARKITREIQNVTGEFGDGMNSYINTDMGPPYRISVEESYVGISPRIWRLYWEVIKDDSNRIIIYEARPLVHSSDLSDNVQDYVEKVDGEIDRERQLLASIENRKDSNRARSRITKMRIEERIEELETWRKEALREDSSASKKGLDDAHFLFQTLVLLRNAKATNSASWTRFMRSVRSKNLIQQNPLPWVQYKESVCNVYPLISECTR